MKTTIKITELVRVSESVLNKAKLLGFNLLESPQYKDINGIIYEVK